MIADNTRAASQNSLALQRYNQSGLASQASSLHVCLPDLTVLFIDRAAAQSLIRGKDGDVSLGWDMPSRRSAAVLCFDEMQVTDPFAAVALKG